MRDEILRRLADIEHEEGIRILYACESGSRAWGFHSPDSDFDVRFLYVRPLEGYLSLAEARDVIECPISGALDMGGWDLKKALKLLRKTNVPLLEWLGSPVRYRQDEAVLEQLQDLARRSFQAGPAFQHYLGMARNALQSFGEGEKVRLKSQLYATRTLLCCRWIERHLAQPPIRIHDLMTGLLAGEDHAPLRTAIERLIARKQAGEERSVGERIPILEAFLREPPETLNGCVPQSAAPLPEGEFDRVFRGVVLASR